MQTVENLKRKCESGTLRILLHEKALLALRVHQNDDVDVLLIVRRTCKCILSAALIGSHVRRKTECIQMEGEQGFLKHCFARGKSNHDF